MSKREISSLLEDIDKVFIQGKAPSEANLTLLTEGISAELVKALSEEYVSAGRMRLSAIGKKDRQLWYDYNGYDKEPLSTATRIKDRKSVV